MTPRGMEGQSTGLDTVARRNVLAPNAVVINPYLIAIGVVYVVLSWIHLPSSIWIRSLFVCFLVWRMQPDIIIPMLLASLQIRLQLGGLEDYDAAQDMASQLTGFEQYAFAVPCVLYAMRTFFAVISARSARRDTFPFWLYGLYLFALPLVLASAVAAYGEPAWTAAVRSYSMVSLYFYGLLLPPCRDREMDRLASAFAFVLTIILLGKLFLGLHTRQIWLLMPFIAACLPLMILRRSSILGSLAALMSSSLAFVVAANATFTILLQWLCGTFSGIGASLLRKPSARSVFASCLLGFLLVVNPAFMLFAAVYHDPSKDTFLMTKDMDSSTGRAVMKILCDRGPIWWGALVELYERPTLCAVAMPKFWVVSLGKGMMWPYIAHNIILDNLLRFGMVAGPIVLMVLLHMSFVARNAIANYDNASVNALAITVISNVLLGGITLPYILNERESEYFLMTAGLLGYYARRKVDSRADLAPNDHVRVGGAGMAALACSHAASSEQPYP